MENNRELSTEEYEYARYIYGKYDPTYEDERLSDKEVQDELWEKYQEDWLYGDEENFNEIKNEFYGVCDYMVPLYEGVEYYDGMLELSDNHTLFELEVPDEVYEVNGEEVETLYQDMVEAYLGAFEAETGVTVYLLGRSGRHVCVEDNLDNFLNYRELQNNMNGYEQGLIEEFNAINWNDYLE